jgi:hypothetical protein
LGSLSDDIGLLCETVSCPAGGRDCRDHYNPFGRRSGWTLSIAPPVGRNYNSLMTIEQMRKLHSARPFQPFDIYLADGRTLPIEHPELLLQSQSGRTIAVANADDTIEVVDLLLVVSIKTRPEGPERRGHRRS